jgi:hypothetical protein
MSYANIGTIAMSVSLIPIFYFVAARRRDTQLSEAATAFRDFMRFAVAGVGLAGPPVNIDHRQLAEEAIQI